MKYGKANYEKSQFKKKNHFNLSKGSLIARIIPPIGDLAEKGVWNRYYSAVFGYKNAEGKLRVFASPLVKKKGIIEVPCAATERVNDLKAKLEEARVTGNAAVQGRLNKLVGLKGVYSIDSNFHLNVILLDGTIGELKIRYKAMEKLKLEIEKLRADGVDPLSPEDGRFFVFSRSGQGRDTLFDVVVYKEKIDVPGIGQVEKPVVHKLTPEIDARIATEAFNLDKLFTKLTSDEVAEVVTQSDILSGKSPAVDRLFDARWKAEREAKKGQSEPESQEEDQDNGEHTPPDTTAPTASSVTSTTGPSTPNNAITASAGTPAVTAQLTTPMSAPTTADDELSDEEFFRIAGIKTSA